MVVGVARWCLGVFVGLNIFAGRGHATEIVRGPILVHPDDDFVYLPRDAAFVDDQNLLITYSRGTADASGSVTGAGDFLRRYDVATGSFGPQIPLNSVGFGAPPKVDGDGGINRAIFLVPTGNSIQQILLLPFTSTGIPTSTAIRVESEDREIGSADVAVAQDGTTLVVWFEVGGEAGRRFRIFGQLFDPSLNRIGGEFTISPSEDEAAFPRVDAHTHFNVVWDDRNTTVTTPPEIAIASLEVDGDVRWRERITAGGSLASVTTLSTDGVYVAYHRPGEPDPVLSGDPGNDVFATLFDLNGNRVGTDYRLSLPREGNQLRPGIAASGTNTAVAFGSTAGFPGRLEFVRLDARAQPLDADPALIDNRALGTTEVLPNQFTIVAGGPGDQVAVLYNAEQFGPLLIGRRAKLLLLRAGFSRCPSGVSCTCPADADPCVDLSPFRTTGAAANRLNVVLRPSRYPMDPDGTRVFLRELRELLLVNFALGSRHHRARYDKFNFLYQLTDADVPDTNPSIVCPGAFPASADEFFAFQEAFPWVIAAGAQLSPAAYSDRVTVWCALAQSFANGGGDFTYPAYAIGVLEHELAHAIYGSPDEYEGGSYIEDSFPGPFPSQYASLAECQADATAEGWDVNECHLACDFSMQMSCRRDWYSAELRPPAFNDRDECVQWQQDHPDGQPFQCQNLRGTSLFHIPELTDLMVDADTRQATPSARTLDFLRPPPSFQRACERRALFYLDDPRLSP